ncbi:MAG: hypothetical protein Ta2F_19040 [Termitinemataceae bacterium]|nr:MAG: hypothetical protein Ta2F_19040 [Termitinemataceae bacterium]
MINKKNCPDKQILCEYIDGEIPSPWKEKLEAHIVSCIECLDTVSAYKNIHKQLNEPAFTAAESLEMESAKSRVMEKLESSFDECPNSFGFSRNGRNKRSGILTRSIDVPVPFAAAAAAVLVLSVSMLFVNKNIEHKQNTDMEIVQTVIPSPVQSVPAAVVPISYEFDENQSFPPSTNMAEILNYLNSTADSSDIVIIKLPEKKNFKHAGEAKMFNTTNTKKVN